MSLKALLDEGQLGPAIDWTTRELKSRPGDVEARTSLFQLLGFAGEWARAGKQLDVIGHQADSPQVSLGLQLCRQLLAAEIDRARFWASGGRPKFLMEPPRAIEIHLEALTAVRENRVEAAVAALASASELRTPASGTISGVAFDDFRDADDLLSPILEVFAPAGYCWVPWEQIQYLEVASPKSLRDLLWMPAKLASFDGQLGEVFLPNLYPDSHRHADDALRLGRKTEWSEGAGGIVRGAGMKVFLVGDEDRTLPELGQVQFSPPSS